MPRTPTTRRRRPTRAALTSVAVITVVAALGCGGDDDEDAGTDPTAEETTTTPSTTTPPTPEEEAKAVYLELVDVVYELMSTSPDPDNPDLSRLATEPLLRTLQDSLSTMAAEHHVVQQGEHTSQDVLSVTINSPSNATLRACSVGEDTTVDQDDGSVVSGGGVSARLVDVTVVREPAGTWQVSEIGTVEIFDGESACPG